MKKTKIVATIGPACTGTQKLKQMVKAGMSAARINTAHGNLSEYDCIVENIRKVADIPIMFDIKGPEMRIQSPDDDTVKKGDVFTVGFGKQEGRYFNRDFYEEVQVGDTVYLSDGMIKTEVVEKVDHKIKLKVHIGGFLRKNKGVNIPGRHIDFGLFTPWDKEVIAYAKEKDADFIALSFTRTESDVEGLRKKLKATEIGIISKIESRESLDHLPEIIAASDGIMVARGDLGVEVPSEKLPVIQKQLIWDCNEAGKPVIVATEMLKSMIKEARPPRAETSDVANAILDGADAIMLSDETAIGAYPIEAVNVMNRIANELEPYVHSRIQFSESASVDDSIADAVHKICEKFQVSKVVTLSQYGYAAQRISRYRLKEDIIAILESPTAKRKLELTYGVTPIAYKPTHVEQIPHAAKHLVKIGLLKPHDLVLFTGRMYSKKRHITNVLHMHKVEELLEYAQ
ncbi:Pyruvate kinase [uncultured archaeon]|nr:Pyruvate kinase [uncultured archaeon]